MLNDSSSLPTGEALAPPSVSPSVGDGLESLLAKLLHVLGGGSGAAVVADTTSQSYRILGIIVLTDAVFEEVGAAPGYAATDIAGVTFPAGLTLPFRLDYFNLVSGSVLAIKA